MLTRTDQLSCGYSLTRLDVSYYTRQADNWSVYV